MSVYLFLVILLFSTNTCRIAAQIVAHRPSQSLSEDEIQAVMQAKLFKNKGKTTPSPPVVPEEEETSIFTEEEEPKVVITPSQNGGMASAADTTNRNFKPYTGSFKGPLDLRKLVWERNQRPEGSCNLREKTLVCPSAGTYVCISPAQLCDSKRDCPDGADERPTQCMFSRLFAEYDELLDASMRKLQANVALSSKSDKKTRLRKLRNKNKKPMKRHMAKLYDMY